MFVTERTHSPYQTAQFTATLLLSCGKVAANNLVHQKREMQFAAIRNYCKLAVN